MDRRSFLAASLAAGSSQLFAQPRASSSAATPTLDAHVHLFDPTRTGGVPWPEPSDLIYRPALPDRLQALATPLGVVGAIAIEASPLRSDNDWLLHAVSQNPFMVGMIGDLVPGSSTYHSDLNRLRRSPLFLGIRYGNLWNRDLATDLTKSGFLDGLRHLSEAGLTFEAANPTPSLLQAVLSIAQRLPELRIVLDHVPHLAPPSVPAAQQALQKTLDQLAQSHHVFLKLSEVLVARPGAVQRSSLPYRNRLDPLWNLFGPDRILFGSDWPNSDHIAPYAETLAVAQDYVQYRDATAAARVFHSVSQAAYKWQPRLPQQRLS